MAELLSYSEIWSGFLAIDEILLYLHHSMRVEIEYDGQTDDVSIEIVTGPRKRFEDEIVEHLKEHFDDYTIKRLVCTRCNNELIWQPNLTNCTKSVYQSGSGSPSWKVCGAPFELVRYATDESWVREKAELALMGRGSELGRASLVGVRIADRLTKGRWHLDRADIHLRLEELRENLRAEITDQVDRLNSKITLRDPARLLGRRDLYPRGETLVAKYADYLGTRDKLISCYHFFDGQTANHPEFAERDEQARGIRVFRPPVHLPARNDRVPDKPAWDSERRELRFRGRLCKAFTKTKAPNQTTILQTFQDVGWASRIDDPLPFDPNCKADRKLRETIRGLKNRLKHITFRADGTGSGVIWEPVASRTTHHRS